MTAGDLPVGTQVVIPDWLPLSSRRTQVDNPWPAKRKGLSGVFYVVHNDGVAVVSLARTRQGSCYDLGGLSLYYEEITPEMLPTQSPFQKWLHTGSIT